jgi:hypothetical protein
MPKDEGELRCKLTACLCTPALRLGEVPGAIDIDGRMWTERAQAGIKTWPWTFEYLVVGAPPMVRHKYVGEQCGCDR